MSVESVMILGLITMGLLLNVGTVSWWLLAMARRRNQLLDIIVNSVSSGNLVGTELSILSEPWLMEPGPIQPHVFIVKKLYVPMRFPWCTTPLEINGSMNHGTQWTHDH